MGPCFCERQVMGEVRTPHEPKSIQSNNDLLNQKILEFGSDIIISLFVPSSRVARRQFSARLPKN